MVRVTLCFAVLLAVFGNGLCLKCYQCTSAPDKYKCQQQSLNFTAAEDKTFLKDCDLSVFQWNKQYLQSAIPPKMLDFAPKENSPLSGKYHCAKITNALGETARTCLPTEATALCKGFLDAKALKECSTCDTDACNSSSAISASLPVALIAFVLSYILYKQ